MDSEFSQEGLNPPLENDFVDNNVMQFCSTDGDVSMDKCDSQEDSSQRMDTGEDSPVVDSSTVQWFSANSVNYNNVINSMPDSSLYDPIEPLQDDDVPNTPQNMEMPQEVYSQYSNVDMVVPSVIQDVFVESSDLGKSSTPLSPKVDVGDTQINVPSQAFDIREYIAFPNSTLSDHEPLKESLTISSIQESFEHDERHNVESHVHSTEEINNKTEEFTVGKPEDQFIVLLNDVLQPSSIEQSSDVQQRQATMNILLQESPVINLFSNKSKSDTIEEIVPSTISEDQPVLMTNESLPENNQQEQDVPNQKQAHTYTVSSDQCGILVQNNESQPMGFEQFSPDSGLQQTIHLSVLNETNHQASTELFQNGTTETTVSPHQSIESSCLKQVFHESVLSKECDVIVKQGGNITEYATNPGEKSATESVTQTIEKNLEAENSASHPILSSEKNHALQHTSDRPTEADQDTDGQVKLSSDDIETVLNDVEMKENLAEIDTIEKTEAELADIEKAKAETELAAIEKAKAEAELAAIEKAKAEAELAAIEKAKAEAELAAIAKAKAEAELAAIAKAKAEADLLEKFKQAELEGFWLAVRRDPTDFTSWTNLLEYVEKEDRLDNLRQAFDTFLHRYPYCYGYWKKYADVEKRHNNREKCLQIYERGVVAIPLSIDLWLSYVETVSDFFKDDENCNTKIREIYSRAIDIASMDFRSDRLWESFIQWELTTQTKDYVRNVTSLYDRLIYIPTQMYYQNWENFKRHMEDNSVQDLFSDVELESLKREIILEMGHADDIDVSELEFIRMKDKARGIREEIYNRTYEEITKRWHFEEKIRRPYFHVKPLESTQLSNWHEYLDFEESEFAALNYPDDPSKWAMQRARVQFLYERCLVACALYEEMWLRYARFAENILQDVETARNVWRRACTVHLSSKHSLRWHWACFEERQAGSKLEPCQDWRTHVAWQVLEEAMLDESGFYYPHEEHKNNPLVHSRRLDMMRRLGASASEVVSAYEESLKHFNEMEFYSSAVSLLSSRLARFLSYHVKNVERAKKILEEAIQKDLRNERLFTQLLDLIFHTDPLNVEAFCELIDFALERSLLPIRSKIAFAKRRLQYLEEFDSDVDRIRTAQEDFERLVKARAHAEDPSASTGIVDPAGDGPEAKRPLLSSVPTSSIMPPSTTTDPYTTQANYQTHYSMVNPPPTHSAAPTYSAASTSQAAATTGWDQYAAYYYSGAYGSAYTNTAPPLNVPPPVQSIYPSV